MRTALLLVLFPFLGFSQEKVPLDSVDFKIINNETDFNQYAFILNTGLHFDNNIDPNLLLNLTYERQTTNYRFTAEGGMRTNWESYEVLHNTRSVYGKGRSWNVRFNYTYFFYQKDSPYTYLVPLTVTRSTRLSTSYLAKEFVGKQGLKLGLDLGWRFGTNFYSLEGTGFIGTDLNGNQYEMSKRFSDHEKSTFQDFGFMRLGLSLVRIQNIVIESKEYNKSRVSGGFVLSAGVLFAAYNRYDDVFSLLTRTQSINGSTFIPENNPPTYLRLDLHENSTFSPFGFVMQIQNINTRGSFAASRFSLELGFNPGDKENILARCFTRIKLGYPIVMRKTDQKN